MVFTLVSWKSLWLRLWPNGRWGLFGSTSFSAGVAPRYQAVGEDGESSRSDLLLCRPQDGCRFESEVLRVAARLMPYPISSLPCPVAMTSPNKGRLLWSWRAVGEVGDKLVIDFEA
jgi:hypothetical protein